MLDTERDTRQVEEAVEPEEAPEETTGETPHEPGRIAGAVRRHRLGAVSLVVAAVLALAGALFLVRAAQLRGVDAAGNSALVDDKATRQVIAEVSDGLGKVFSYSYTDTDATSRAADAVLFGKAKAQYEKLFSQVTAHAADQKLTLKTTVVEAGVRKLSGDDATVLAFLDQHATRADTGSSSASAAQLLVTAHRSGGHWHITSISNK